MYVNVITFTYNQDGALKQATSLHPSNTTRKDIPDHQPDPHRGQQ